MLRQLQTMQASPLQTTAASGTAWSCAITFDEAGVAHLADMVAMAFNDDPDYTGVGNTIAQADLLKAMHVSAIKLNGSMYFLQARNTPVCPAALFSVERKTNWVGLPSIRVGPRDVLTVTFNITRTGAGQLNTCIAVPFTPDSLKGKLDDGQMNGQREVIAATPLVAVTADGLDATMTLTFDVDGLVDIGRAVATLIATLGVDINADGYDAYSVNDVPLGLLSVRLRSERNLIGGAGTVLCPNIFHWARRGKFANLGVRSVESGEALVVGIECDTDALLSALRANGARLP